MSFIGIIVLVMDLKPFMRVSIGSASDKFSDSLINTKQRHSHIQADMISFLKKLPVCTLIRDAICNRKAAQLALHSSLLVHVACIYIQHENFLRKSALEKHLHENCFHKSAANINNVNEPILGLWCCPGEPSAGHRPNRNRC